VTRIKSAKFYLMTALLLAPIFLCSCLGEALEKQAEQIKQQEAEIAQQRDEINALLAGKKVADQKQIDCNRAFRDYFEKAQVIADREQAITLYREGLGICPDDEVAHYELGKVLAERGRKAEAEIEFQAALKITPDFVDAQRQLEAVRNNP
jgi:tetratricopeptide (TPR) repeat protein